MIGGTGNTRSILQNILAAVTAAEISLYFFTAITISLSLKGAFYDNLFCRTGNSSFSGRSMDMVAGSIRSTAHVNH
jgi:hypothetical protein